MVPLRTRTSRRLSVITQMPSEWMERMQLITTIEPWHIFNCAGTCDSLLNLDVGDVFIENLGIHLYVISRGLFTPAWVVKKKMALINLLVLPIMLSWTQFFYLLMHSFPEAEADCTKALGLDKKVLAILSIFFSIQEVEVKSCEPYERVQ